MHSSAHTTMLWIKQPGAAQGAAPDEVTGTVIMMSSNQDAAHKDDLKKNDAGVILLPQPHNNPNDPLNWPMWRRDLAMLTIGLYSFIVGGQTPLLAAVMTTLEEEWDEPLRKLTYLVGVLMLGMGFGSLFFAPTAVLYGKRLVYLVSQCVFFAGLLWGANAKSYGSLIGARVLCGIGGGPAESLPSATIAEIYFAHERAYRTGIYTLLLLGGKNLVPLVAGFVASTCGWHWIFYIVAIIVGGCWLATFVFVHETWWDRTPVPNQRSQNESAAADKVRHETGRPDYVTTRNRMLSTNQVTTLNTAANETITSVPEDESTLPRSRKLAAHRLSFDTSRSSESRMSNESHPAGNALGREDDSPGTRPDLYRVTSGFSLTSIIRTPFFRNLRVYTGKKCDDPWGYVFLRPFFLYAYPPVLFSSLLYSLSVVWLSVIAETLGGIFTASPYNFKVTSVGLLYIGTFIGGCLGSAVAGKSSDIIVRFMSKRNGGIYEPEFRLVMILPVAITTTIGMMGFGWSTFDEDAWIVPTVFLGFIGFGTSLGSTVSITYAVDSYKMFAAEALVSLNFLKNLFGFCFGIFVPIFLENTDRRIMYVVFGAIQIGLCLTAIPLYRYGKVCRHYMDEHNIIKKLYN